MRKTTYIVNGNADNIEELMEGTLEAPREEAFILVTTEKCSDQNKQFITECCEKSDNIKERKVKHSKNFFSTFAKSVYKNFIKSPDDRVVIIPQISIGGPVFTEYVGSGKVIIRNRYMIDNKQCAPKQNVGYNTHIHVRTGGPVHILIDYENVNNEGLVGSEYLSHDDHVTLFYSDNSGTIQHGHFENLSQKAGSLDMVKLKQVRRNGLDFYIAMRVGQLLETHRDEKILIISRDQGYLAVMDYCEIQAGMTDEIQLANTIETGLVAIDGDTERRHKIIESRMTESIDTQYALYKERMELYEQIKKVLTGTPYFDEIESIFGIIADAATPRDKYTTMLHLFGLDRGREIYRLIKQTEAA